MSFTQSCSQALTTLPAVHDLLNLANHRNKNQHRLSKWWKEFSQLRRHVSKLISELSDPELRFVHESTAPKKKPKKEKQDRGKESRDKVELRVEFLEDVLIPKCYMAFSNVVADNQYSTLGLLLIGCLARIQKAIRPLRRVEEVKTVVDDIPLPSKTDEIDLGERVRRDQADVLDADSNKAEDEEQVTERKKVKKANENFNDEDKKDGMDSSLPKRPKKKRKKGDAFDNLFASLL
ncbi:hypothetical protein B7463_g10355, partial [Scytalidium lignicola]